MTWMMSSARLVLLLPLLAWSGCISSARLQKEPLPEQGLAEVQANDEILTISNGKVASRNQFPSTVYVALSDTEECSGALIHPRLVVTAAHCVCRGREDDKAIILDSSNCAKNAVVKTGERQELFKKYAGQVRPHPDFKVRLEKKKLLIPHEAKVESFITEGDKRYVLLNVVVRSDADLAVIVLDQPVNRRFPPVALAQSDIKLGEPIVTTGYGAAEVRDGLAVFTEQDPIRRFGRNVVTKKDGELFTIEEPGSLSLPGDSGGPCFREETRGPVLVGISSRSSPGKRATFTNTYRYLRWLSEEIKRADQFEPTSPTR